MAVSSLSTIDAIAQAGTLPSGATLLLLGAPDTGKTFWTLEAVRALTRAGKSVAVLDCDLGQSEIGPPGTVGVALVSPDIGPDLRSLRDLSPLALAFVGALSPPPRLLEWAAAAAHVARAARAQQPDLLLVDTCGWVTGAAAVDAKHALINLLAPDTVFAFQRGASLDPLLHTLTHLSRPAVFSIVPAAEVARKTPAARATRRMARFARALEQARDIPLSWNDVALRGTRLGQGEAVPHHVRAFVSDTLRARILHAERLPGGGLLAIVNGENWSAQGLSVLEAHFRTAPIQVVAAQSWAGLLVGLVDTQGGLLDIGLLSRVDFDARTVTLLTPCRRPAAVAQVWLGTVRLRPDGQERGARRPAGVPD